MNKAIDTLKIAVDSFEPYLQESGEVFDPVFAEPTQYGTAYHALCRAVLAVKGPRSEEEKNLSWAIKCLDASLRHVNDPSLPPNASSVDRATGMLSSLNHRDFFWPPILKAYRILKSRVPDVDKEFSRRIAATDIMASFRSRPPSNWAMVWLSGEWIRMKEGLSQTSRQEFDSWLAEFFRNHILIDMGFYQEPGHPNSYDLFTRFHLADILMEGYEGAWRGQMERLMETGLSRSLAVQLSDGSLASAHRSTGQTWTVGAQCAFFTHAANYFRNRDPEKSGQTIEAARRAFASFLRWQRTDGPFSPVENLLPPGYRVGYETYTADAHYSNLAMGFLAVAILNGFDGLPTQSDPGWPPTTYIEGDPTYRAIAHHGPYTVHLNAFPAPHYDGFGIVDITFGPGRRLHFVSSVRHLSKEGFYNIGMALRSLGGRSALTVISQEHPTLIGSIEKGPTKASLSLSARSKGSPYIYKMSVSLEEYGVNVEESTPGLIGFKTLLIPYLKDGGWKGTTEVKTYASDGRPVIMFTLGSERIRFDLEGRIDHIVNLPYGYENRRGLCGLLRIDFKDESERIRYKALIEA